MKVITIKVFGLVHGVWFRASTQQKAIELGVCGTVQNMEDGTVLITAEGKESALEKLVEWCRTGPPKAKVEDLLIQNDDKGGFKDFIILR